MIGAVPVIQQLIVMVVVFLASLGLITTPKDYKLNIVYSDHALTSHSESRYNAKTISEQIKNYGNNNKSSCDDVQIHLCTSHLNCYSPHAKLVCVQYSQKESTILVIALDELKQYIAVTGYKIDNGRLMRQIINDKCFAVSIGWLKYMFNITH